MNLPLSILAAIGLYLLAGALFALAFVAVGLTRIDPAAKGSHVGVRLLLLPGSAALWPVLLVRWLRKSPRPASHTDPRPMAPRLIAWHRAAWPLAALLAAAVVGFAWWSRPAPLDLGNAATQTAAHPPSSAPTAGATP